MPRSMAFEKALAPSTTASARRLVAEASRVAMADNGVLPLHFEIFTWAMRKELS